VSTKVEFGSLDAANQARDDWSEFVCPVDDDQRLTAVAFVSDTPEDVLEAIRIEAQDARTEQRQTSRSVELTEDERERISDLGGFDQRTTTLSWASAKGVFGREGLGDQFHDAMGALTDYDDPAEGAEEWIRNQREADATRGTAGVSGGRRDAGDVDQKRQRKAGAAAAKARGEGCQQAHDYCSGGDEDACKHLREVCGYEEDEVREILASRDDRHEGESDQRELVVVGGAGGEFPSMEVSPQEAGALRQSWQGYKGAVSALAEAVEAVQEHAVDARQALAAINAIRGNNGQDDLHGDRLHDLLEALDGLPEEIPETRTLAHFSDQGATTSESPSLDRFDTPSELVDGPRSAETGSNGETTSSTSEFSPVQRTLAGVLARLARSDDHQKGVSKVVVAMDRLTDAEVRAAIEAANEELREGSRYDVDALGRVAKQERVRRHELTRPPEGRQRRPPRTTTDRGDVLETDDQRTLGGSRADAQARLAGGERGERGQGEALEAVEENPGGLAADRRENTGKQPNREQGDLSQVGVSEGLRDADQHDLGSLVEDSDDNQSGDSATTNS
jgi:hypothetical protein